MDRIACPYLTVREDIKEEERTMDSDEEQQFTDMDPLSLSNNEDPLGLLNQDIQLQDDSADQHHTPPPSDEEVDIYDDMIYDDISLVSSSPSSGRSQLGSPEPSTSATHLNKPITGAEYRSQEQQPHQLTKIKLAAALTSQLTIKDEHSNPNITYDQPAPQRIDIPYNQRYYHDKNYAPSEFTHNPADTPFSTPLSSPSRRDSRSPSPYPHPSTQHSARTEVKDRQVRYTQDGQIRVTAGAIPKERSSVPTAGAIPKVRCSVPTDTATPSNNKLEAAGAIPKERGSVPTTGAIPKVRCSVPTDTATPSSNKPKTAKHSVPTDAERKTRPPAKTGKDLNPKAPKQRRTIPPTTQRRITRPPPPKPEYLPNPPDWSSNNDLIALNHNLLPGTGQCSCPRGTADLLVFDASTVHMMSHSPRCKININRDANNINNRVADLMELVIYKDEQRDTPLNNITGPKGANDLRDTIDLDTLVKLSSVKGETRDKIYDPQLNLSAVHLLIQHTIKELVDACIIPEGKLIYSDAISQLFNQNLATHMLSPGTLAQIYSGAKLFYPMSVHYAKDADRRRENRGIINKIVQEAISQYNDRDHDYYTVMSFGSSPHWYLILITTNHCRRKEPLKDPKTLAANGAINGGRITVTYQSINHRPLIEVARHMHRQLMKEMTNKSPEVDLRDDTCSGNAVNNPIEKERHIELTGKQTDHVNCGMYLGDAIRQIYTIKHHTGNLPEKLCDRTDDMMECWRRRILKDMWPRIDWRKDILKEYFYFQAKEE